MNGQLATQTYSLGDIERMAAAVVKGGLFSGIKTIEAAVSLMLICQAEKLHPMSALRRYHIIQGRPTMRADAMQAEFQRRGGSVRWIQHTDQIAEAEFTGPDGHSLTVRWTTEDARRAGLTGKDVWKQYPRAMLSARCVSEGVRAVLPDCVVGIYTPEEAESLPPTDAGIEEMQEARDAHSRANAGPGKLVAIEPGKPLALENSPGVERFDGFVLHVEPRDVTEKNEKRTVYDVTLARPDKSTLLVGTRKVALGDEAATLAEQGVPIVAKVKAQSNGHWMLLQIEAADLDQPGSVEIPEDAPDIAF